MKNLENVIFRKTALADPIFTLDGGFQLLWAAFDLPMTVVPLKVGIRIGKNLMFGHLKKIIEKLT